MALEKSDFVIFSVLFGLPQNRHFPSKQSGMMISAARKPGFEEKLGNATIWMSYNAYELALRAIPEDLYFHASLQKSCFHELLCLRTKGLGRHLLTVRGVCTLCHWSSNSCNEYQGLQVLCS